MSNISVSVSRLRVAKSNVRVTQTSVEDDQALRASIKAHGLLNNLVVKPCDSGDEGYYAIIAGGRRYKALCDLIACGDLSEDYLVSCEVCEDKHNDATALSLAENFVRAAMSPVDEFEAFTALADQDHSVADIALQYGCSEYHVRQRLRLGRVASDILQAHRDDKIDLQALMVFAMSKDQARQLSVFKMLSEDDNLHPRAIKHSLLNDDVLSTDKMAQFVGMEAYSAAGGSYTENLFSNNDNGEFVLHDPRLIETLAQAKLDDKVEELREQGWKWVEARLSFEYWQSSQEFPHRLETLRNELSDEDKAHSGCIVSVGYNGSMKIDSGLQTRADVKAMKALQPNDAAQGGEYSQALQQSLQDQRLALLAVQVAQDWSACQDVLLYTLLKSHVFGCKSIMGIRTEASYDPEINAILSAMMPEKSALIDLDEFENSDNPLEYVAELDIENKRRLLSVCTTLLLCNDREQYQTYLAQRTQCDPVKQWRPTVDNFWCRLTKKQLLAVATEVLGEAWSKSHAESKKAELTALMERIFAGHSVAGIRADQTARALAWVPAAMTFGEEVELPPLAEEQAQQQQDASDDDNYVVTKHRVIPTRDGIKAVKVEPDLPEAFAV